MINVIAPVESTRSPTLKYTAQGLGDRIHLLTIIWALSNQTGEAVSLHLSGDKNSTQKRRSFEEILKLFPGNRLDLHFHDIFPETNSQFRNYLLSMGIQADSYFYSDHMGWRERKEGIEVSGILKNIPLISPPVRQNESKLVTCQWDATGPDRRFAQSEISQIMNAYLQQGFELVTVGGEAKENYHRDSLSEIAKLMSRSAFHVGVDSGFFHLAQLMLPPSRIHVYSKPEQFWSHHLFRGIEKGMMLNVNFKSISPLRLKLVKWRYDSPMILRAWHAGDRFRHRKR